MNRRLLALSLGAALCAGVDAAPEIVTLAGTHVPLERETLLGGLEDTVGFRLPLAPASGRVDRDNPTLGDIALRDIAHVQWRDVRQRAITSGPETEFVSLGDRVGESLPAEWASGGAGLGWQRAQAPQIFHEWQHLPGAQWVWSHSQWSAEPERERVLLRQRFEIPAEQHVVDATLHIRVDDRLQAIRLNGVDLAIPPSLRAGGAWQVTDALQVGLNTLAFVAVDSPPRGRQGALGINAAGLAFRLEIDLIDDPTVAPAERSCIAHLVNGDRLSGRLVRIDDVGIILATPMDQVTLDRDWVAEIFLAPLGAQGALAPSSASLPTPVVHGLEPQLPEWAPGVLLDDGTHLAGRILSAGGQSVDVKPRYSDATQVPLDRVRMICVNAPMEEDHIHFPRQPGAARICRVETVHGDRMTGVLERVGDMVEINPPESEPIRFAADLIVRLVFPLSTRVWGWEHLAPVPASNREGIVLWGERETPSEFLPYRLSPVAQINNIAQHFDFGVRWISDVALAAGELHPESEPVLIVVDEREQFPLTVASQGDGLQALLSQLQGGGAVLMIPTGTPFYHAREWDGLEWYLRPLRQEIPNLLGLHYLQPGNGTQTGRAFEVPDNVGETLHFEKVTDDPRWDLLPQRVEHPILADVRFRPVSRVGNVTGVEFEPIYRLMNDQGENLGFAMAAVRFTEGELAGGEVFHIAPTLALAHDGADEPMMHRLLPTVLVDALVEPDQIRMVQTEP